MWDLFKHVPGPTYVMWREATESFNFGAADFVYPDHCIH
jgi:hypothetical protein